VYTNREECVRKGESIRQESVFGRRECMRERRAFSRGENQESCALRREMH
jgi:hypothetical protein